MNSDHDTFQRLQAIKSEKADELLSRPGVTGVAVGYRKKGGALTTEPVIIVYVEKKKSKDELSPPEVISVEGAAVDIQEHGPMVAQYLRVEHGDVSGQDTALHRPVTGGIEIGPTDDWFVGTLGAIFFDAGSGKPAGLTNWHVAAGSTSAPVGRSISQPGNAANHRIGVCSGAVRGASAGGDVDAAAIAFDVSVPETPLQVLGIGAVSGQTPASIGQSVVKQGRTTDRTTGRVSSLGWTGDVNYDGTLVRFANQILIEPVGVPAASRPGDSGAVWLSDPAHAAVGLNFAGDGRVAIANPIGAALAAVSLRVELGHAAFYRWYNPSSGDHFYTQDSSGELAPVSGYRYEGVGCRLVDDGSPEAVPLHRWFRPASGDHFYTTDPSGELAPTSGYRYEGVAGHVARSSVPGLVAWNRWYNRRNGDHFYTVDPSGELAPTSGYVSEGITGWVLPS